MFGIIITIIVGGIIAVLPILVRRKINSILGSMKVFTGSVREVRINPFAGSIVLIDLCIRRRGATSGPQPVISTPYISVSFEWKRLLQRNFFVTTRIERPQILIDDKTRCLLKNESSESAIKHEKLKDIASSIRPFLIGIELVDGNFRYIDTSVTPVMDVTVSALQVRVHNLTNIVSGSPVSPVDATGVIYKGKIVLHADVQLLMDDLTFDLKAAIRTIDLALLNMWLRQYLRIDVSAGSLDLYAELTLANNVVQGQITPVLKNLDFRNANHQRHGFWQKAWERVVGAGVRVLNNRRKGELTASIPVSGTPGNIQVNIRSAIVGLFEDEFFRLIRSML